MHLSIQAKNHALVPAIRFFATVCKIRTYKVIVSCTFINLRCYASGEIKFRFLNAAADTHARAHAEIKDTPCFARKRALPEKLQRSSSPLEDTFYSFYNSRVQRRKLCNIPSHLRTMKKQVCAPHRPVFGGRWQRTSVPELLCAAPARLLLSGSLPWSKL